MRTAILFLFGPSKFVSSNPVTVVVGAQHRSYQAYLCVHAILDSIDVKRLIAILPQMLTQAQVFEKVMNDEEL